MRSLSWWKADASYLYSNWTVTHTLHIKSSKQYKTDVRMQHVIRFVLFKGKLEYRCGYNTALNMMVLVRSIPEFVDPSLKEKVFGHGPCIDQCQEKGKTLYGLVGNKRPRTMPLLMLF